MMRSKEIYSHYLCNWTKRSQQHPEIDGKVSFRLCTLLLQVIKIQLQENILKAQIKKVHFSPKLYKNSFPLTANRRGVQLLSKNCIFIKDPKQGR